MNRNAIAQNILQDVAKTQTHPKTVRNSTRLLAKLRRDKAQQPDPDTHLDLPLPCTIKKIQFSKSWDTCFTGPTASARLKQQLETRESAASTSPSEESDEFREIKLAAVVEHQKSIDRYETSPRHISSALRPHSDPNAAWKTNLEESRLTAMQNQRWYEQGEWKPKNLFTVPNKITDKKEYYQSFYSWLSSIPTNSDVVMDTNRKAFFDGTAVPDGDHGFMIQRLEHPSPPCDMSDQKTRSHWHETAAQYVLNYKNLIYEPKVDEGVSEVSEVITRSATPYLRFATYDDADGLTEIFKTYAGNSPLSSHLNTSAGYVRNIISCCTEAWLPFIVAVQPTYDPETNTYPQEEVLGYAYIKMFSDYPQTGEYTGELEVFVAKKHQKQNLGRSLVGMILTLCSSEHKHLDGTPYKWHSPDCIGKDRLKIRPLMTLLCGIAYPSDLKEDVEWIPEWLKREFDFEKQGTLKKFRVQHNIP
ncbi:hypothetical protein N7468_007484 [Penicillium chermesinum]|uniref:N-acetyltransferase domain-containing protein n=1 Tax=Penicillium chermesinum TaxID=63820 RepID=A0A9W9NUC9_9EURO|nr:uncharacterized protein N7468_007484 [Penicillium chermesinum]KAJ5226259.1 hypothetical protein N7468_007484 [Penicillium chermesinum]